MLKRMSAPMAESFLSFLADAGLDEEVQHMIRLSDSVTSGDEAGAHSGSDDGDDDDVRDHIVAHDDREESEDLKSLREGSVVETMMPSARRYTQVVPLQPTLPTINI